jgi:hypothetical protein
MKQTGSGYCVIALVVAVLIVLGLIFNPGM